VTVSYLFGHRHHPDTTYVIIEPTTLSRKETAAHVSLSSDEIVKQRSNPEGSG
jgi:hypothetical protein